MTDISKYRNVSLTHDTYNILVRLSKTLLPDAKLSISKYSKDMENQFPDSNCVVHEDDVDWGG